MRVNNEAKHTITRLLIGEALPAVSKESSVTIRKLVLGD